ncbi:AMP-binding protein [Micromonospora sp. C95]|uniref:AMP-binding protein n=1 Tax=Micromonospora sp. C95 TaxID=2824882 RepID=UPI001B378DA7|nr:AMP-binding protein [Micromonospora sp. C95]MBQ1026058.1 AMP-binding protein [Micromonospora sp. C95]
MITILLGRGDRRDAALFFGGQLALTHGQLPAALGPWRRLLDRLPDRGVVLLSAKPSAAGVLCHLAVIESGHVVMPVLPQDVTRQMRAFEPDLVVFPAGARQDPPVGYRVVPAPEPATAWMTVEPASTPPPNPDLSVVLLTSGSVGPPRGVRLPATAVAANAASITTALGLTPAARGVTSLALHHSYGLSVLHSHLFAGGSVSVTAEPPTTPQFWREAIGCGVTVFAGVPLTYEALARRLEREWPPGLRAATQAGGALRPALVARIADVARRHDATFFVMYGQTEATARMAVLDATAEPAGIGSVGRAIAGGRFQIAPSDHRGDGEVVYHGPNVMHGYAANRADLVRSDELHGRLHTGDLGRLDGDLLYITGRRRRITKLTGARISLDEMESAIGGWVVEAERRLHVFHRAASPVPATLLNDVCARLSIPLSYVSVCPLDTVPMTATGKVDYPALVELAAGNQSTSAASGSGGCPATPVAKPTTRMERRG